MNQELAVRKAEVKLEKAKLDRESLHKVLDTTKDISVTLLSNPAFTYIAGMMLISVLGTLSFKTHNKQGEEVWNQYLPSNEVFAMGVALSTAMGIGALGGSSGIANIIKALK